MQLGELSNRNSGQPYMVAEAYVRRLTQMRLKKADTSSFNGLSRRLVDAQRTLSNLGNRLDNEDLIISLMIPTWEYSKV